MRRKRSNNVSLASMKEHPQPQSTLLTLPVKRLFFNHIPVRSLAQGYLHSRLNLGRLDYALGVENQHQFLERHFGCNYSVIRYLEEDGLSGNVIDNWSVWFAPSVSFYAENNSFVIFGFDKRKPASEMAAELEENNIRFIYFDEKVKERHTSHAEDQAIVRTIPPKLYAENFLLDYCDLIFEMGSCKLYKIDFDRIPQQKASVNKVLFPSTWALSQQE